MLPEPRAARHRRAVRHAGVAVPGPHRSRPRPRARHRHARRRARSAAISTRAPRHFPQDVLELQAYFAPPQPGPDGARHARRGARRADLAARLEPVQRAARGPARAAVRVRVALRARPPAARRSTIYRRDFQPSDALAQARTPWSASTSSPPTPTTRRGGCSRRCSSSSSTCAAGVPSRLQHPDDVERRRVAGRGSLALSRMLNYSVVGSPASVRRGPRRVPRADPGGRADGHRPRLRPRRPSAIVRAGRRHPKSRIAYPRR